MNKKVLISLAGAALISTGLATIAVEGGNTVDAAKTSLVKGKTKKLARNAYVYNSKGKRVKKRSLKKGKKIKILGFKTIKGKKYVQIGKNEYVVAANFTPKKAKSKPKKNTKKNTSKKVAPSTENEDDSYQEKAPSYANEPEYKKYMEWVKKYNDGKGDIVAIKGTTARAIQDPGNENEDGFGKDPKELWDMSANFAHPIEKGESVNSLVAGEEVSDFGEVDLELARVLKSSDGTYYLQGFPDIGLGYYYFPATDFKFVEKNMKR
ncbi:SLAP domain-containing protein [Lactobacillus sp. LL6]|uniref:SLAP domain-containing protein n=1 Tax=Lactobacillus sp. LL6 TaxID=2596827 RepID=UPI001185C18B|nr:SLAP domain-containing protein [Lactobacillus sp. LL6]TSO26144.1 hypothetical protein FOD82_03480 [Lactobacillus sp. LL6]